MKNLIVRSISGAIYVAIIVCSILLGGDWAFGILCCVFVALGIPEFQNMMKVDFYSHPRLLLCDLIVGILLPATIATWMSGYFLISTILVILIIVFTIVRFVSQLYVIDDSSSRHLAISVMSIIYVALPITTLALLFYTLGSWLTLLMFVMIWCNDTGAFIVGSAFGRKRLFPRHSPKKSWEGFFGGLVFSVGVGYLAGVLLPQCFGMFNINTLGGMGLIVTILATWGDLFESMLKRSMNVKDSGNMIPGHGGILDRIDSLLFVAPAITVYFTIVFYLISFTIIKGA